MIVAACQIYLTLTPCVGVTCGHCGVYDIISWQCEACLASVCQRWLWLQQAMGETDSNNNDAAHGAIIPLSIPSSVFFFFFLLFIPAINIQNSPRDLYPNFRWRGRKMTLTKEAGVF